MHDSVSLLGDSETQSPPLLHNQIQVRMMTARERLLWWIENQIIKVTSESLKRLQRSPAELIQRIQKIYFHLVEDMEKNVTFSFDTASDEEDDLTFHIDVPISEAELTGWVNKDILWIFNEHVPRSVGFTSLQMGRCFFFDSIWASSNKHLKLKRNFDLNFHVNLSNVDHTRTGCHFTHSANFNIL